VLIDWEYARLGDPADEVAYIFGQHGLSAAQRAAFWAGYGRATAHPRLEHLVARAEWWEPVLLLGSALWWLERWSRRAAADDVSGVDPSAPKPPRYYLDEAIRRLDRFDDALADRLEG
jgi:thiamine kinase-like enzyme